MGIDVMSFDEAVKCVLNNIGLHRVHINRLKQPCFIVPASWRCFTNDKADSLVHNSNGSVF